MQIQMADICTKVGRAAEANQGIHISAIQVDLTASFMDDPANFPNTGFKDAVGRRISDH